MSKQKQDHFLKLYEPVHTQFERFCRVRVYGDMDYEDLMNETLLVAFEKLEQLKSEKAFLSFLFGICVRLIANNSKKIKERAYSKQNYNFKDVNAQTERDAEVYLLHQALAQLPVEQKEAIILFEMNGFSIKEITEIQNASESAVKQRLKRGREKLTQILSFERTENKSKEVNNG